MQLNKLPSIQLALVITFVSMLVIGGALGALINIFYWIFSFWLFMFIWPIVQFQRNETTMSFLYLSATLEQRKLRLFHLVSNIGLLLLYLNLMIGMEWG